MSLQSSSNCWRLEYSRSWGRGRLHQEIVRRVRAAGAFGGTHRVAWGFSLVRLLVKCTGYNIYTEDVLDFVNRDLT